MTPYLHLRKQEFHSYGAGLASVELVETYSVDREMARGFQRLLNDELADTHYALASIEKDERTGRWLATFTFQLLADGDLVNDNEDIWALMLEDICTVTGSYDAEIGAAKRFMSTAAEVYHKLGIEKYQ